MMDSALSPACFETLNILENFIYGQSENKEKSCWTGCTGRKLSVIFKMSPSSNLAEAVNASYAHRGSCNISLVRAAYEDSYCEQYIAAKTMETKQSRCKNLCYWTFRFQPNCSGDSKTRERLFD